MYFGGLVPEIKKFVFRFYNKEHSVRGKRNSQSIQLELDFMNRARGQGIVVPQI
jgi:hypothetical protein